jgi:hypothetical protein
MSVITNKENQSKKIKPELNLVADFLYSTNMCWDLVTPNSSNDGYGSYYYALVTTK